MEINKGTTNFKRVSLLKHNDPKSVHLKTKFLNTLIKN